MKTLGLIGGMSWESTLVYYKSINRLVKNKLGGYHSCKSIIYSVDFAEIEKWQHAANRALQCKKMIDIAQRLEQAGAELLVLCSNTMHHCYPEIIKNINIPFLHIAQTTGDRILNLGLNKPALLGTSFTMEQDFYTGWLKEHFEMETLIPDENDRKTIHAIIYEELVQGKIREHSREKMKHIIKKLAKRGADCVILGCTEIPLLIRQSAVSIPLIDTTTVHAEAAVIKILS